MIDAMIVYWKHSDGRLLPFNHKDAKIEVLSAVRKWKNSPGFYEKLAEEYAKQFASPQKL